MSSPSTRTAAATTGFDALPNDLVDRITSFMQPRDQATFSGVSPRTNASVARVNPAISNIRGVMTVGTGPTAIDMFNTTGPGTDNKRIFAPMDSRGYQPKYPHLTVAQTGATHLTDVASDIAYPPNGAARGLVRYDMAAHNNTLGPAVPLKAKPGQLIQHAPDVFVRKENYRPSKPLADHFKEPLSPRTQARTLAAHSWSGKTVT